MCSVCAGYEGIEPTWSISWSLITRRWLTTSIIVNTFSRTSANPFTAHYHYNDFLIDLGCKLNVPRQPPFQVPGRYGTDTKPYTTVCLWPSVVGPNGYLCSWVIIVLLTRPHWGQSSEASAWHPGDGEADMTTPHPTITNLPSSLRGVNVARCRTCWCNICCCCCWTNPTPSHHQMGSIRNGETLEKYS